SSRLGGGGVADGPPAVGAAKELAGPKGAGPSGTGGGSASFHPPDAAISPLREGFSSSQSQRPVASSMSRRASAWAACTAGLSSCEAGSPAGCAPAWWSLAGSPKRAPTSLPEAGGSVAGKEGG